MKLKGIVKIYFLLYWFKLNIHYIFKIFRNFFFNLYGFLS